MSEHPEAFKDNFSRQAAIYARFRPHYPHALFAFLASLTPLHELAWDCGTGNGQAAIALAGYYGQVFATDPSIEQLRHATTHERVEYRAEIGEHSSLSSATADLITVANAMHWFNLDNFYAEVRRVLKPGGILAAWCYGVPAICPEVDAVIGLFHDDVLGEFWVPENRMVEQGYRELPFPFEEVAAPVFYSTRQFTLDDVIAYLDTWSATQKYMAAYGTSPTAPLYGQLLQYWGDPKEARLVTWPLALKVGSVAAPL